MPPGDFYRVLRRCAAFTRGFVPGQFVDNERLYLAHQRLKICPDKEPGFCSQFIEVYLWIEKTFQILEIGGKDRLPCRFVRRGDVEVFFQPAGAEQGRIRAGRDGWSPR